MTRPARRLLARLALALSFLWPAAVTAQQAAGPRILSGGVTFQVDDPSFVAPEDHVFRAVFEIAQGDGGDVNPQINTIARYLNLHARHGVPDDRVQAAAVIHGGGWTALLSDAAYAARFDGRPNPSRALVEELMANGVDLVLCGQTAAARGLSRDELLPGVQVALSAMTALNVFASRGYHLNPW